MSAEQHTRDKSLGNEFDAARRETGISQKNMRARLRARMFGAPSDPVRLGRFTILDRLGQGGMGVVYSAYDPELDRKVALKIVSTGKTMGGSHGRERLRREAQALARLSHPNVVPVHDAGVIDDQVFIVMEFVVGTTLREWVTSEQRSWRDVLDAYMQAGLGLVAAHEVGLVHRDFKPDNVQVGEDGRVRVLDFGLARARREDEIDEDASSSFPNLRAQTAAITDADTSGDRAVESAVDPAVDPAVVPAVGELEMADTRTADSAAEVCATTATLATDDERMMSTSPQTADGSPSAEESSNQRLHIPITATGALLGTPAYMSPEQHSRDRAGPASDQFSFCASLYEGLYGQRAFAGDTLAKLRDHIFAGEVRPPAPHSKVPRWIFPVLRTGLSTLPGDRYPSMKALLTDLGRDPARMRKRRLLGLMFAVLVATTVFSLAKARSAGKHAVDKCTGAERELARVWNPAREHTVEQALLATDMPYAAPAWQRVSAGLDQYADAWVAMHEDACRAHQRGEQSGQLLDRRMACLSSRRVALHSAISVLAETDAGSLENAVDVVHKLPAIDFCADVEALAVEVAPPEDPHTKARVDDIRQRLSRVVALESAGRYPSASELLQTLVTEAMALGYQPLMAELLLVEGRIRLTDIQADDAIEPLRQAASLGLSTGMNRVGLEALARYVYASGASDKRTGDPLGTLFVAEAMMERLEDSTFVHALLLNNAGVVYMARSSPGRAREYFERALAVKQQAPSGRTDVELTVILRNLALVTPEYERRVELMRAADAEFESALGKVHPQTLENRRILGYYIIDPEQARALLESVCADLERYHPSHDFQLNDCWYHLGFLNSELGDHSAASRYFARVAQRVPSGSRQWLPDLANGYRYLYEGHYQQALEKLDSVVAVLGAKSVPWWLGPRLAEAEFARGAALLALHQRARALKPLERALSLFAKASETSSKVGIHQRLASTRTALAQALWPAPAMPDARSRARAIELVELAETWYRNASREYYERQLQQISAWRQERGIDQ